MGPSSSDSSDTEFPQDGYPPAPRRFEFPEAAAPPYPAVESRREPVWRYAILFLLTVLSTTYFGQLHYASFVVGFSDRAIGLAGLDLFVRGFWYSASILAILGTHEMGHYLACRYYRVDASAPYFLPAPLLTGTFGAFIRIRQPIPGKRELFDIGIAGPIAGFVVALPVLMVGMYLSNVVQIPTRFSGQVLELGEPLLFKAVAWLTFGTIPEGYTVNLHPMAFAAWFGLLATALNLFPIGQLDGGHISYAVLGGRKSTILTLAMVVCLIALTAMSLSWLVWTMLTVTMLLAFGPRHPRVFDEHVPLDRTRLWLALFALVMFVLCFSPTPIEPKDLLGTP